MAAATIAGATPAQSDPSAASLLFPGCLTAAVSTIGWGRTAAPAHLSEKGTGGPGRPSSPPLQLVQLLQPLVERSHPAICQRAQHIGRLLLLAARILLEGERGILGM